LTVMTDGADDAEVVQSLEQLQSAEFLYETQTGAERTYMFKHVLTLEVAYGSLLPTRRQMLHARVAQVLTTRFPTIEATQPELLAHHSTEAGLSAQAIRYWYTAGQRAVERSAHTEALRHLTTGLTLLKTEPETPERAQQEVHLLMLLGHVYMATTGYGAAEVLQTYDRVRALSHHLGTTP